jgi:hypothetical protein
MRAREWLYEVRDPKVAALQRAMRKAGALNVEGPDLGKPLTVDGIQGPNTRANMDLPQFAGIVRQHTNPSGPHARGTVADADSLAPGEEIVPQSTISDGPHPNIDNATRQRALDSVKGITGTAGSPLPSLAPAPTMVGPEDDYISPHTAPKVPPKYDGIDPIVRSRMGMPPATTAEIDAYMKAHPAVVGGVVDGSGKPIISGGAAEIEKDARKAAKDFETKQGPNPNINKDTRDKAGMATNETGGNFDITFGDRVDPKTNAIVNGQYKTVAQWSQETLGTPLQLTQLTLDQVQAFQKYKSSVKDNSGAVGAFQFMPTTLFGSIKNGKLAPGLVQQNNIPMTAKFDQQLQQQLQDKFMAANDSILKKNGVDVNSGNRYMAHYIGPSGAVAVYKDIETDPNITVAQSMVKHGYRDPTTNNPELAILTVSQFPDIMAKRMAGNIGYGRPTAQQFAALKQRQTTTVA